MSATDGLKARWQDWSRRFAALQPREKTLVAVAVAAVIVLGGFTLWVDPALQQSARLKKALEQQQNELSLLQTQIVALASKDGDPDAANRAALVEVRKQLTATDAEIHAFDGILVAPRRMPLLLQTLLAKHRGLALVSLTTLAPQPLIEPKSTKTEKDNTRGAAEKPALAGGNLYKHGLEIKLAGGYAELAAYVAELQASPQKMLWGKMSLEVKQYPVSELTLTIYTLSPEATWLVV